ncbi:hypothetical protein FB192DRAFT_1434303 [Mucor lusitanicus]|uniref:Uncharacterized protein n=2 Tax=Mucor circinelloides f. lusitanicus TaxID=29924 RepID=A0A162MQ06_MUCCL|nr:hypothetical protein FB192DRAFT_1434303 [Mucor lusitanicus]OAD04115.1 hypothetical protein MUCCIDRAFT_79251 [Mucor lusitanicus CBS 277.49]
MNVDSRPPVVYPTFHDSQQQKPTSSTTTTLTPKETAIDDSIYHLLSMYLDTNTSVIIPPATTATQNSRVMMLNKHSPYFRTKRRMPSQQRQHQNWLGENKKSSCTELERNTIKNSYTASIDNDAQHGDIKTNSSHNKTKTRSKSVSFSETVTVINLQAKWMPAADDNEDDEDLFVDALENFTE